MNALLQGHTASTLSPGTFDTVLQVQKVSLEYRTPQRVVRATHEAVSYTHLTLPTTPYV